MRKRKILLVEDYETLRLSLSENLRQEEGIDCDCAATAEEAEARLSTGPYDVLISEVRILGNEELRFFARLPQLVPSIPTILISGHPFPTHLPRSFEPLIRASLRKPFELEELWTVLDQIFATPHEHPKEGGKQRIRRGVGAAA